jgi:hypothetical protein
VQQATIVLVGTKLTIRGMLRFVKGCAWPVVGQVALVRRWHVRAAKVAKSSAQITHTTPRKKATLGAPMEDKGGYEWYAGIWASAHWVVVDLLGRRIGPPDDLLEHR